MDRNYLIITGLIVVIVILVIGLFMVMPGVSKENTQLTVSAESPVHEGDAIKIKLTDGNNTPIANQTINVTITDKDNASSYYSVVTNDKGVGKLKIDKSEGTYSVHCVYAGNDKYNGNDTTEKITVEKEPVQTTKISSSSSSSSSSSEREEYKVTQDGWNPREHEVSRERLDSGYERVTYDDGYFRIVDDDGNIITYGW